MKILTVLGARPQFVKAAMVSREFAGRTGFDEVLLHTGQHFDDNMSRVFFEELSIPKPAYNLGISASQHGEMTGRMLIELEKVIAEEKPDGVLVYGDTNSTLAGAVTAAKSNLPLIHVEAGLRSWNRRMPEEINRIVTDRLSALLLAPSQTAIDNLDAEGFDNSQVRFTGDVMFDSVRCFTEIARREVLEPSYESYVLCTLHRAENVDDRDTLTGTIQNLEALCELLGIDVVLPIHPRTRNRLEQFSISTRRVTLIEPVGYLEMLRLVEGAELVLTDSGGLQKEAFFCGKPCITLRSETEWVELVDIGVNSLLNPAAGDFVEAVSQKLNDDFDFTSEPYGNGRAAALIVDCVGELFSD